MGIWRSENLKKHIILALLIFNINLWRNIYIYIYIYIYIANPKKGLERNYLKGKQKEKSLERIY